MNEEERRDVIEMALNEHYVAVGTSCPCWYCAGIRDERADRS